MEVIHWVNGGGFTGVPLGMVYRGACTRDGVLGCMKGVHMQGLVCWGACTGDKVLGCTHKGTTTRDEILGYLQQGALTVRAY